MTRFISVHPDPRSKYAAFGAMDRASRNPRSPRVSAVPLATELCARNAPSVALWLALFVATGCTSDRHGARPPAPERTGEQPAAAPMDPGPPATPAPPAASPSEADEPKLDAQGAPAAAHALLRAYPDQLCAVTREQVRFCDGSALPWDDGRSDKTFEQKLDDADLEDQMSQAYATGAFVPAPPEHDPGRFRNLAFFKKIYGGSPAEVRSKLRAVPWPPTAPQGQLHVTQINGVDRRLEAVAAEVARLSPAITAIVAKPAGGFNWRQVRGTERLSAHSFGIAVDVGVGFADYWRWKTLAPGAQLEPRNRIPMEVVAAFERHGFIWGGRWHHFDTMHFEYRPELLPPATEAAHGAR